MGIPKHYLDGLSKTDREIQKRALLKARKKYNKKEYLSRPKLKSFKTKESRHITDFHKKYQRNDISRSKYSRLTNQERLTRNQNTNI